MQLLKQDKDWNCRVYAVKFLMWLNGEGVFSDMEKALGTTEESGTGHEGIKNFFGDEVISEYDSNINEIKTPALVNYQYDGDGHYGVIINIAKRSLVIYNPAIGELEILDKHKFVESWYSDRYGNRWYLALK